MTQPVIYNGISLTRNNLDDHNNVLSWPSRFNETRIDTRCTRVHILA
jgi:hypothetical protein